MIIRLFTFILSIIFFILWLFLLTNKPKYIIYLTETEILKYHSYFMGLYIAVICIIVWLLMQSILKWVLKTFFNTNKTKQKKVTVLDKMLTWSMNALQKINIFSKTYTMILDFIGPEHVHKIIKLAKLVLTYSEKQNIIIIVSFVLLPRLIIVLVFIIEIYLGKLHYYFYFLLLLLIPLIFRLIILMLKDIGPRILPEFQKFIITEPFNTDVVMQTPSGEEIKSYRFRLTQEALDLQLHLGFLLETFYYPLLYIEGHIDLIITPKLYQINLNSMYFYYITHFLGLTYILYYLI